MKNHLNGQVYVECMSAEEKYDVASHDFQLKVVDADFTQTRKCNRKAYDRLDNIPKISRGWTK